MENDEFLTRHRDCATLIVSGRRTSQRRRESCWMIFSTHFLDLTSPQRGIRMSCRSCRKIFNVPGERHRAEMKCPRCGGELPLRRKLEILREIALGLEHAHRHGIIHRDLKPANIMVPPDGRPVITDFGLARNVKRTGKSGLTLSGDVVGTPSYMSPEQARGQRSKVGPQADVYALGAIMYQMLTGRVPFAAANVYDVLQRIVDKEPTPPSTLRSGIDRDAETICLKALEKELDRRYGSAREFADDLGRHLKGEPILARPSSVLSRLWRDAKRNRTAFFAGVAATVVAVIASPSRTSCETPAAGRQQEQAWVKTSPAALGLAAFGCTS